MTSHVMLSENEIATTLHPAPFPLHPTLYTLHPTPCTLHPERQPRARRNNHNLESAAEVDVSTIGLEPVSLACALAPSSALPLVGFWPIFGEQVAGPKMVIDTLPPHHHLSSYLLLSSLELSDEP